MGRYRPPPPKSSKFITPEGAAVLEQELDELWRVQRPEVTRAVAAAAAQGDRSENAEYIYGKRQLAQIDRRVRFLRKRLDGMRIVADPPSDTSRIYFGAWFETREEAGATGRHRIVGPDECSAQPDYISMDAPLARAALGKRVGDEIVVHAPAGERHCAITRIEYTHCAGKKKPGT